MTVEADAAAERRAPGRRRDPDLARRVLEATRALVAAEGVRASSVTAIARDARVGKPSIYLRWRNLNAILVAAIEDLREPLDHVGGASVEESLVLACEEDHEHLVRGPHLGFLSAVLYASAAHPEIERELWRSVLGPRHERLLGILRGEPALAAAGNARLRIAADLLQAPILQGIALRSPDGLGDLGATTANVVRGIGRA